MKCCGYVFCRASFENHKLLTVVELSSIAVQVHFVFLDSSYKTPSQLIRPVSRLPEAASLRSERNPVGSTPSPEGARERRRHTSSGFIVFP